ncbi:MAG: endonuclease domain-containing protein [Cyclobacteriaceae bacterium]
MKIYYNRKLKHLARKLRNDSTLSEVLLWNELKAKQLNGYQFMRQKPIGNYIVDFFYSQLKLVIEIDGDSHDAKEVYLNDLRRQKYLEKIGLAVLRFDDLDVKEDIDGVLEDIKQWIVEKKK